MERIVNAELRLEHVRFPKVEAERRQLESILEQKNKEKDLIEWLTSVMAANAELEAEDIIKRFHKLEKDHEILKKQSKEDIDNLQKKLGRVRAERKEVFVKMKR